MKPHTISIPSPASFSRRRAWKKCRFAFLMAEVKHAGEGLARLLFSMGLRISTGRLLLFFWLLNRIIDWLEIERRFRWSKKFSGGYCSAFWFFLPLRRSIF